MFLEIFSIFQKNVFSHFFSFYHKLWKKNNKIMVSQNKKPHQSKQSKPRSQVNHDLNKNDLIILIPSGAGRASLKVTHRSHGEFC